MKNIDPGLLPQSVCFPFTPSPLARKLYFYPLWCGHYYCTQKFFMRREDFPSLLVIFVREGLFHFEYQEKSFDAGKGDVVLIDCMEPHYYHACDGLEFVYMHFNGSNSCDICHQILDQNGPLIQKESNEQVGSLLFDMVNYYIHDGVETIFQSSMRIYKLFEYLLAPASQQMRWDNPVSLAIRYIRANVGKEMTLDKLAQIANLSPYYFAHCFKEQTGFAPMEYVINTRMDRARKLLALTSKSVEEIAHEVGYSSSSSLINMFLKRVGKSPKQFRLSHQSLTMMQKPPVKK